MKSLLRPRHKKKEIALPDSPAISSRGVTASKDKRKEEREAAKVEERKVKASRKEIRKAEKFKAVLRSEKRDAESEYAHAKKQAEVAKAKAKGAQSREAVIGAQEVKGAKMTAKIEDMKAKLAKHMFLEFRSQAFNSRCI